jgi:hypothetical protein
MYLFCSGIFLRDHWRRDGRLGKSLGIFRFGIRAVHVQEPLAEKRNDPGRLRSREAAFGMEQGEVVVPVLYQFLLLKYVNDSQRRERPCFCAM